jgi:uncharacterized protein (DUF1800 family)
LDRRQFLKIGAALAGAAAIIGCSGGGGDLVKLASAAVIPPRPSSSLPPASSSGVAMRDDLKVPHLLRRAGFGASPQELEGYRDMGFTDAVQRLLDYEGTAEDQASAAPQIPLVYSDRPIANELYVLADWWLNKMAQTTRPLEEKMTLFWHNHFATGYSKVENGYLMYKQNEFLRQNALGNFKDILMGITSDGAMLVWLDGNANGKVDPNENYSRELMEVFTTGRSLCTEANVQAGARIFTGFSVGADGAGVFHPDQHDDGVKTYVGRTGNFMPADAIEILAARPETAANLSTELFEFFAYPNPPAEVIERLSDLYFDSDYDVGMLVEAILTSDEFVSEEAYLANVKSPAEYVATALRSLSATAEPLSGAATIDAQGQLLFDPPSVFGWPSGMAWINSGSLVERYNFPLDILTSDHDGSSELDAGSLVGRDTAVAESVATISQALFPEGMPDQTLSVIESSTAACDDPTLMAKNSIRLAMASPFYNLN